MKRTIIELVIVLGALAAFLSIAAAANAQTYGGRYYYHHGWRDCRAKQEYHIHYHYGSWYIPLYTASPYTASPYTASPYYVQPQPQPYQSWQWGY